MAELKNPILIAQIGAAQGIKGEVRVKPFTGDPLALGDYGPLFSTDGRKFRIKRLRPAKNMLVVKFEGVNTRNEAETLNRTELFIDRTALPDDTEEDEFYAVDLIGMDVVDEGGAVIGRVASVQDFGAGDLLEIAPQDNGARTWFLEFTRANVPDVNLETGKITISVPDEVSEREDG